MAAQAIDVDTNRTAEAAAVGLGLRIALAATLCLFFSEFFRLGQRSLSVYTAHLAMVMFPHTAFQKVVERIVGRVAGVAYGIAIVALFRDSPVLLIVLMTLGQMAFFYVNASENLAYAALMGGLFLGVVVQIGLGSGAAAETFAIDLVQQLVLAGVIIVAVNAITGAERDLTVDLWKNPLFPIRPERLSKAAMVSVGQTLAMFVSLWFDLPVLPTMVSATILGISTNDVTAMTKKGYQRAVGAVLGGGYAVGSMMLLSYVPSFLVMCALVFYGMFLAAYYTKASTQWSYAFMQMGLVLPMVLVGTTGEMGTISTGIDRLIGVAAGLATAEVVMFSWPFRRS